MGGKRTRRRGRCWSRAACVRRRASGWGGGGGSDPGWPALVQCLAELARVVLWMAPRLRVDLVRLLDRCSILAERCPIPRELWDELVPAGLPERLRGVQLPEGKGYPTPETEVMLEVLKGQGVFAEVQLPKGEQGGPNCTLFVILKNDIKASMILNCIPGT